MLAILLAFSLVAALTLAPVGVVSAAPATIATPSHTSLKVHSEQLNVLENHRTTVTGKLLEGGHDGTLGRPEGRGRGRQPDVAASFRGRLVRVEAEGVVFANADGKVAEGRFDYRITVGTQDEMQGHQAISCELLVGARKARP